MISTFKKIIFWSAVVFIMLSIFSLTIMQKSPYEFADYKMAHNYYDIIIQGLPLAILLTLFGTIRQKNIKIINVGIFSLTIVGSIISFIIMVSLMFQIGFGAWITLSTLYRHKTENRVIKEQILDVGAFGYGGRRIVEIKPVLKYWILPTKIDTLNINKNEWIFVNEKGDIKEP